MTALGPGSELCVFLGSNLGGPPYRSLTEKLGRELVRRELGLVYGGAQVGLMGVLADAVLERGGRVTGVIPRALARKEVMHQGLSHLEVVGSMHERKQRMAELADGFVAVPGGLGTLEELLEVLTWAQLGIHAKPCGLLNVGGYFDSLLDFLDHATREGFVRREHREMLLVASSSAELLDRMAAYEPPRLAKWLDVEEA